MGFSFLHLDLRQSEHQSHPIHKRMKTMVAKPRAVVSIGLQVYAERPSIVRKANKPSLFHAGQLV